MFEAGGKRAGRNWKVHLQELLKSRAQVYFGRLIAKKKKRVRTAAASCKIAQDAIICYLNCRIKKKKNEGWQQTIADFSRLEGARSICFILVKGINLFTTLFTLHEPCSDVYTGIGTGNAESLLFL